MSVDIVVTVDGGECVASRLKLHDAWPCEKAYTQGVRGGLIAIRDFLGRRMHKKYLKMKRKQ